MSPGWLALASGIAGALLALYVRERRRAARATSRLGAASRELERLQLAFGRFAPEQIVERIIGSGVSASAENKVVTVLFADLVGFTSLSEGLPPDVLVDILNGYFTRMSRVLAEHRGHVSKFIGDGILALFGALEPNPWQANDAAHAALAMRSALAQYNRDLSGRGLPALRFGIGIHRGPVVAGVVGSNELMEFTVVGNTVNLASRVERLTRLHETDVLVTDEIRAALDPRFVLRELPPASAPGISEPIASYAIERFEEAGSAEK